MLVQMFFTKLLMTHCQRNCFVWGGLSEDSDSSDGNLHDSSSSRGAGTSQEGKMSTYFSCVSSLQLWGSEPVGLTSESMSQGNSLPVRADCGPDFHVGCESADHHIPQQTLYGRSLQKYVAVLRRVNKTCLYVSGGPFLSHPSIPRLIFPSTFISLTFPQISSHCSQVPMP